MDTARARALLQLHRPGPAGDPGNDPLVAEALALARRDPELARWLAAEQASDAAVSARLEAALPVPAGLRERLLAAAPAVPAPARRAATATVPWWWPALAGTAAAAVTFLATVNLRRPNVVVVPGPGPTPVPTVTPATVVLAAAPPLEDFRSEMVAFIRLAPPLELETKDPDRMRDYLRRKGAPADVLVPAGLERLPGMGCRILRFRGRPVALLCFLRKNGVLTHLLVMDRAALPTPGTREAPVIAPEGEWLTAAWTQGEFTYLLCAKGDEELLQGYLAGS